MSSDAFRFGAFVLVSLVVFLAIIRFVLRERFSRPGHAAVLSVAAFVVVGGMLFAKYGNNAGLPWWIYYSLPALATLAVPPTVFGFSAKELAQYLVLAFLSSPAIHVAFSFLLGWHEYMPFIAVPSLHDLLSNTGTGIQQFIQVERASSVR